MSSTCQHLEWSPIYKTRMRCVRPPHSDKYHYLIGSVIEIERGETCRLCGEEHYLFDKDSAGRLCQNCYASIVLELAAGLRIMCVSYHNPIPGTVYRRINMPGYRVRIVGVDSDRAVYRVLSTDNLSQCHLSTFGRQFVILEESKTEGGKDE